jgi:hypothetical protein
MRILSTLLPTFVTLRRVSRNSDSLFVGGWHRADTGGGDRCDCVILTLEIGEGTGAFIRRDHVGASFAPF